MLIPSYSSPMATLTTTFAHGFLTGDRLRISSDSNRVRRRVYEVVSSTNLETIAHLSLDAK